MTRSLRLPSLVAALLLSVLSFSAHGSTPAFGTVHALWMAETEGVLRLEIGSGEVLLTLPLGAPVRAVEADLRWLRVWAVAGSKLHGYELDGSQFAEVDLAGPTPADVFLEVDPADGSLWIGIDRGLRNVAPAGQVLLEVRLDEPVEGLAIDPTERRVWAATRRAVVAFDAVTGLAVETLAVDSKAGVRDIDVSPEGALWVVLGDDRVLRFGGGATTLEVPVGDAQKIAALGDGGAWVAGRKQVVLVAPDGAVGTPVFPFAGDAVIEALVADPLDSSVWVANQQSVGRLSPAGVWMLAGKFSRVWDLGLSADIIPPVLSIVAPADGRWVTTKRPEARITYSDVGDGVEASGVSATSGNLALAVSCMAVAEGEALCRPDVDLPEGDSVIVLVIVDKAGNPSEPAAITLRVDTIPPEPVDLGRVTISPPEAGSVAVTGEPGSVEGLVEVALTNLSSGASVAVFAGTDGSFEAVLAAEGGDEIEIVLTDAAGNRSAATVVAAPGADDLPPDPEEVAPAVDPTVVTDIAASTAFLYSGPTPIQTGVAPGTIEPRRAAVLRGKVLDSTGTPLGGVRVTVHDHPEYGQTLTRTDGMFDLAVNGGGVLTVAYEKADLLPVQRKVAPTWRDFSWIEDVVMIPFDPLATAVEANAAVAQVATGSEVTDADGRRRAVLVFPAGTGATLVMPDGSTAPLGKLSVRATEYTIGETGPLAMPAPLPETSGYTYAVELSVDEAVAVGAQRVEFSQPIFHYVENFLGFPVGGIVPAGWYDRELAAWVPSENGRVIRVVGITGGLAEVDIDGSGTAASAEQLAALGFTNGEREELGVRYQAGQSVWRTPIPHFTAWDCNWPYGPPLDAEPPPDSEDPVDPERIEDDHDDEPALDEDEACRQGGFSTIECENQILSQSYPIAGTPFRLQYHSDRVPGRKVANSVRIALSGSSVPASLKRIELRIDIAGRRFRQSFAPAAHLSQRFTWDGRDAYGRSVQGQVPLTVKTGYVYDAEYREPAAWIMAFGVASARAAEAAQRSGGEVVLWRLSSRRVGHWDNNALGLGGWQLGVQHVFEAESGELLLGEGGRRTGFGRVIRNISKSGILTRDVEVGPDGSVYFLWRHAAGDDFVTRVYPDGTSEDVASRHIPGFSGIAVGPDGSLYYSTPCTPTSNRVDKTALVMRDREGRVSSNWEVLVRYKSFGDLCPRDVAVGADGSLYISLFSSIQRLWPSGLLTTVAGGTSTSPSGDGPAHERSVRPGRLAVGPDGSLYFTQGFQVRRLRTDGYLETVAGTQDRGYDGEGLPALASRLNEPYDIFVRRDGSLFIADRFNHRVRRVTTSGLLVTIAGDGVAGVPEDGGLALATSTPGPLGVGERPDGELFLTDSSGLRRVTPGRSGDGEVELVPSSSGDEVYEFDRAGRHLRTLDSASGAARLEFLYDARGHLVQVVDSAGNVTRIDRDVNGGALAIVAPFGQRTELEMSANGYLAAIINPNGERMRFEYDSAGMLLTKRDALDQPYTYLHSSLGRLVSVTDPAGGGRLLERVLLGDGYEVRSTTTEGRTTNYRVGSQADGTKIRSVVDPAGQVRTSATTPTGVVSQVAASGQTTSVVEGPDPRFSLQSPLVKSFITQLPSGLRSITTFNRSVQLTSPADPFSVQSLSDEWIVNGRTYQRTFDVLEGRVELVSPSGRRSYYLRDRVGRLVEFGSSAVEPTRLEYDEHGRVAALRRGSGATGRNADFSYSQSGFLEAVTDPLGRETSVERDHVGRPLAQNLPSGESILFEYDDAGRMQEVKVSEEKVHRFSFSPVGLLSSYGSLGSDSDPRLEYGSDRLLNGIVFQGATVVDTTYDSAGRLATMATPQGTYTYSYASTGQLELSSAPGGVMVEYTYDGPLPVRTAWAGRVSGEITNTFDSDFRLTSQFLSGSHTIDFQHDLDGLLTSAGSLQIHRSPEHPRVEGTSVGSVHTANSYNEFGELSSWQATFDAQELISATLRHDNLGRLVEKLETVDGRTTTWSYAYDLGGRLTGVHRDGATFSSYEYDAAGNRTRYIGPFGEVSASYGPDERLTSYGDSSYLYDSLGRLRERSENGHSIAFSYDVLGNLRRVEQPSGVVTEYLIDAEQRRVGKVINGVLTQGLLYKDKLNPIAEVDADGQIRTLFVYGSRSNVPDYMVRDGSLYRIVTDHLGSPRIVIDATTGVVAQRLDYDEFGRILFDSNPGFQPFGFGGGLYEASTGLIRFGARDYDPATGRWTAKDPLHLAGGDFNLYTYAHNDPVNLLDPTGLAVFYCGLTGEVITPGTATAVGDAFIWIDSDGNYGTGLAGGLGGGVGSPGAAAMIGFSMAPTGAAYAGEGGQISVSGGAVGGGVTRSGSKFWGLETTLSPLDGAGGYSVATGTLIQERGNLGDDLDNFQRAMEENWDRLVQAFKDLVDPATYVPELVPSDECGSCR